MDQDTPLEYTAEQQSRRNNLRAPLIVENVHCDDGQKTFFGYAKNISRGGLFIGTVKPREPGDRFKIEITLPTPTKLTFHSTCEVIWKRHFERKSSLEPGMGLKFIDLPENIATEIDEWVTTQLEDL
ncbi:MAG: PilZ domain-containing protein [Desulfuromonadales bacterium]|nr:PilZ domain-containing protein [Desulfuromonadales bacterium]